MVPSSLDGGYPREPLPILILDGGTYPPSAGWGTPLSRPGMGYPLPIQTWDRVPPPPASVDRLKILASLILRMRAVTMCQSLEVFPFEFLKQDSLSFTLRGNTNHGPRPYSSFFFTDYYTLLFHVIPVGDLLPDWYFLHDPSEWGRVPYLHGCVRPPPPPVTCVNTQIFLQFIIFCKFLAESVQH